MNINTDPMPPPLPSMPTRTQRFPTHTSSSIPVYNPGLPSYSHDQYHSRRSRPVVRMLETTSCSSTSTCSTISIAPRRTHRTPQQQQQPIILLPYQCSQPAQLTTLAPIQVNSSSYLPSSATTNPLTVNSIPSVFQPSRSAGSGQRLRAGPIQYVQAAPRSSSTTQLQYVTAESRSARAPAHVLVNRSKTRSRSRAKSFSLLHVPQKDLKFGRRPFDWYANDGHDIILKDNIRVARRGLVSLGR